MPSFRSATAIRQSGPASSSGYCRLRPKVLLAASCASFRWIGSMPFSSCRRSPATSMRQDDFSGSPTSSRTPPRGPGMSITYRTARAPISKTSSSARSRHAMSPRRPARRGALRPAPSSCRSVAGAGQEPARWVSVAKVPLQVSGGPVVGPVLLRACRAGPEVPGAVVEGMLRKIDIIPLQVLIEATIAEVDLNDSLQYGTQFFFKADHIANTLGPLSGLPALGSLTFPSAVPFFTLSKSPNFALSALASVTKVKVLSAPQVMVLDNEPARLQVGQQVPVLTGTATSTLAAGAPVVNSVDYHSTGVIMQVTPRVNSGGLVSLDIAQEVSDVAAAATNTVAGSPTFNDQLFRTRVAVQDGQTVGMAGLIRDNASNDNSGIPFLKDIPILGTLVSTQSNSRARTELLVLITPHVWTI